HRETETASTAVGPLPRKRGRDELHEAVVGAVVARVRAGGGAVVERRGNPPGNAPQVQASATIERPSARQLSPSRRRRPGIARVGPIHAFSGWPGPYRGRVRLNVTTPCS